MTNGPVAQSMRAPTGQSEVAGANPAGPTLDKRFIPMVIANMADADKIYRRGTKLAVLRLDGDGEHPVVRGLSHGGRKVTKRVNIKRLEHARVKTVAVWDTAYTAWGSAPGYHGRPIQFVADMINDARAKYLEKFNAVSDT